jgi:hypothetical protein
MFGIPMRNRPSKHEVRSGHFNVESNWLGQRFRIKKADSFWPIEPLFEFDAGHRTKKVAKSGRKVAFFDRNGSDLTSYRLNYLIAPNYH